jgi:hypothetical protein
MRCEQQSCSAAAAQEPLAGVSETKALGRQVSLQLQFGCCCMTCGLALQVEGIEVAWNEVVCSDACLGR